MKAIAVITTQAPAMPAKTVQRSPSKFTAGPGKNLRQRLAHAKGAERQADPQPIPSKHVDAPKCPAGPVNVTGGAQEEKMVITGVSVFIENPQTCLNDALLIMKP
jgi:hypothetical protein